MNGIQRIRESERFSEFENRILKTSKLDFSPNKVPVITTLVIQVVILVRRNESKRKNFAEEKKTWNKLWNVVHGSYIRKADTSCHRFFNERRSFIKQNCRKNVLRTQNFYSSNKNHNEAIKIRKTHANMQGNWICILALLLFLRFWVSKICLGDLFLGHSGHEKAILKTTLRLRSRFNHEVMFSLKYCLLCQRVTRSFTLILFLYYRSNDKYHLLKRVLKV